MTTVMPRPFELLRWGVDSVDNAIKQSEGQAKIPDDAKAAIDNFARDFKPGKNAMREAMATEIRWMNDGRTFPGPIGPAQVKYDKEEQYLLEIATKLQTRYTAFAKALKSASSDNTHDYRETQKLGELVRTLKTGLEIMNASVDKLRESKSNNKPAYELFNSIKNQVDEQTNNVPFGPFGTLVKFGDREAESFATVLNYTVTDWQKKQEVIEMLYDTACSPFGNLVLNREAADKLRDQFGAVNPNDPNWDKAVNAFKEEHPIVALYAVTINDVMDPNSANHSTNVRELEAMLRAGRSAVTELGDSFALTGPVALAGADLPAGSAALAGRSHRAERGQRVVDLTAACDALEKYIGQLKAGG